MLPSELKVPLPSHFLLYQPSLQCLSKILSSPSLLSGFLHGVVLERRAAGLSMGLCIQRAVVSEMKSQGRGKHGAPLCESEKSQGGESCALGASWKGLGSVVKGSKPTNK